ncbi:expressed protein [Chlorella variabilis]|uniref:Expressed protein n=1 Tax=Chlorella variabilis TaxID=554065 RepID=E1ZEW5_CHLVA|nr:expressed protein [Chlorella variabilis]EFN55728.1 expressed protein [Chlorella variabilis]|eukprot:XP_005847830.1 expressed protein [Chlorella variabilis]
MPPAAVCAMGPASPAKAATSSQRSAGTVSGGPAGGAPEVAQQPSPPSLKRQLSLADEDADSQTSSQGCSKAARAAAATLFRPPPPAGGEARDAGVKQEEEDAAQADAGMPDTQQSQAMELEEQQPQQQPEAAAPQLPAAAPAVGVA